MDTGDGEHEARIGGLTLDEQAALTAGADDWHTVALAARGIPSLKFTDGPSGARGESYTSTRSACFPCGTALAATFDAALAERVGAAIGDEARTKGAQVLLGPTLNLVRHPLGGRNFESYGEDPILAGLLAAAFVRGVQGRGVGACVKHLVANDQELERLTISSDVDERTLREVYLRPFEAAVRDGGAWAVMASYNRVNGVHAAEHHWLLTTILREEWGFDGLVVSDWFAATDTVTCALAGCDLEMPGPARHFGPPLAAAVRRGDVPEAVVTRQAVHVLRTLDRVGARPGAASPERSEDDPGRWALAREAAAAAVVLLRNEPVAGASGGTPASAPVLPLDVGALGRVAVVGPNADVAVVQGGGSARITPHRTVSPLEGLRARLGPSVEVSFAPGTTRGDHLPVLDDRFVRTGVRPGALVEYRAGDGGPVLDTTVVDRLDPLWSGRFSPVVDPVRFHARIVGTLVAPEDGPHTFGLASVGPCVLRLDGAVLLDTSTAGPGEAFFGYGTTEVRTTVELRAGEAHELAVEYERPLGEPMGGVRVGLRPPLGPDPLGRAAALAATADVAIVVVGTDDQIEAESNDRVTFGLTGGQDDLVRAVAAANPRTVVVVNAGAPVDLPWADEVPAVLWVWFGGMALGEALAGVLVGDHEPAGRLPFTIPRRLDDAPCDISRADPPGHLRYTEGLRVGHRWFLSRSIEPRWWFGTGGGYAEIGWGPPSATATWSPASDDPLVVEVPLTNLADRPGHEVVQVYLRRPASTVERPAWVLGGVAKAVLDPGATVVVRIPIGTAALRHWADAPAGAADLDFTGLGPEPGPRSGTWRVEAGPLELRVARSAGDPGQVVTVDVVA